MLYWHDPCDSKVAFRRYRPTFNPSLDTAPGGRDARTQHVAGHICKFALYDPREISQSGTGCTMTATMPAIAASDDAKLVHTELYRRSGAIVRRLFAPLPHVSPAWQARMVHA